ncbi:hypothetical protein CHLNCDRAFT_133698 [Chlorella variabilis]|uniref:RING-type domain-containing protein n=1 Tax=Chlorella variabilis TaxID=554065 RepID=E1Z3L6_CHLVA|nr:hypothetical protein CHLNCDRAFT_133698 [Chlorella variabilis]EFN60184.1 hypothetical protein CHLNCDRAFT_133698 [Chlorella variabilis]|eukprot:XP_005852286.1 hypothetical protein CHLNCDRAFT_133698 [Chlorella variabilis]
MAQHGGDAGDEVFSPAAYLQTVLRSGSGVFSPHVLDSGELWAAAAAGHPLGWGVYALLGWLAWLLLQAPWRALVRALQRRAGFGGGGGVPALLPLRRPLTPLLRTYLYGTSAALLWMLHLNPKEFQSWEDVYFFCGEQYQNCSSTFRWNSRGWMQALVLWNFVLSSALLVQKFVIAWGLGGLLPGEEVVTRESFISIAWRLVPYWMNQWEQQWGAECSSMLFELPHFALELLVVLPCIMCGRLRVMAQPHVREPAAAAGPPHAAPGPAAAPAPAAADADAAVGGGWVPDVMACRWRRAPDQRRLMPRLRANSRAMAVAALILAVAATNSLVVPLALESQPASSKRADQILRFSKELSFLVTTGRHADTALWYQRVAAAAAAAAATQPPQQEHAEGVAAGQLPWVAAAAGNQSSDAKDAEGAAAPAPAPAAAPSGSVSGYGGGDGGGGGAEGAAGYLAAALEGSSNSSRLDAKLAVWSTLWQPLLPQHWLRAVLAADVSEVAALNPAYLSALQFAEHGESAALSQQLHAAANDPRAAAAAAAALRRHREGAGAPALPAGGGDATVQLLLMSAMVAGIDAKQAPLRLKSAAAAEGGGAGPEAAALLGDLTWLRQQQRMYATKTELPGGAGGTAALDGNATWLQQQLMAPVYRLLHKHCVELERMRSADHHRLIPLVEISLAIMRLSCERFFSLLAVFLGFLLYRDPPRYAQRLIRAVAAIAAVFQLLVLYSFPAICWAYGAGALFSSFVSLVFWTGPLVRTVERMRNAATSVQPQQWRAATAAEVERMAGQCAICWGDMPAAGAGGAGGRHSRRPSAAEQAAAAAGSPVGPAAEAQAGAAPVAVPEGPPAAAPAAAAAAPAAAGEPGAAAAAGPTSAAAALPCGHAFHRDCLQQWLQQCYAQGRGATCPMCQASVALRVRYHMPWHRGPPDGQDGEGGDAAAAAAAAEGIPGIQALVRALQDDFRARFEPMLDVAAAGAELGAPFFRIAHAWPAQDAVLPPPPQAAPLEDAPQQGQGQGPVAAGAVPGAAPPEAPPAAAPAPGAAVGVPAAAAGVPAVGGAALEVSAQEGVERMGAGSAQAAPQEGAPLPLLPLQLEHDPQQQQQEEEKEEGPQQQTGRRPAPEPAALAGRQQEQQQGRRRGLLARLLRRRPRGGGAG